jgi:hypothetical protein
MSKTASVQLPQTAQRAVSVQTKHFPILMHLEYVIGAIEAGEIEQRQFAITVQLVAACNNFT